MTEERFAFNFNVPMSELAAQWTWRLEDLRLPEDLGIPYGGMRCAPDLIEEGQVFL